MLGIEARELRCDQSTGFVPDVPWLLNAIDDKLRALVRVTPRACYPADLMNEYVSICRQRGIWLVIDETYRDFLPETRDGSHAAFAAETNCEVIGIYSFSKSLAMPGHRLGAMIYPADIADQIINVQDCLRICPVRAGQVGVIWALQGLKGWRRHKRDQSIEGARDFSAVMEKVQVG